MPRKDKHMKHTTLSKALDLFLEEEEKGELIPTSFQEIMESLKEYESQEVIKE